MPDILNRKTPLKRGWKMLSLLDMYIIKKFLGTYVFAIMLILAITIVFDINEKLDAFMQAPLKATIFDYFLNFLPYFANQFSPLFVFIAVIFSFLVIYSDFATCYNDNTFSPKRKSADKAEQVRRN